MVLIKSTSHQPNPSLQNLLQILTQVQILAKNRNMALVGEAILSASVQVLFDKIGSSEFVDLFRSSKLDESLVKKLEITLLSLNAVLNDAEEKQFLNSYVKEWLDKLQDAVFDADDLQLQLT